jgi:hypothetical protein
MTLMGDAAARNDEERLLVRAAMSRLRHDKAERSNGARTVVALADESGISRQRLYEHHSDLLNEFKATVGCGPVTRMSRLCNDNFHRPVITTRNCLPKILNCEARSERSQR